MVINDKVITVCFVVLVLITFTSLVGNYIQQHRLESARSELTYLRAELAVAGTRQRELKEVIDRGDELLRSSIDTVSDIRRIINQIKNDYLSMEDIIRRNDWSDLSRYYNADLESVAVHGPEASE